MGGTNAHIVLEQGPEIARRRGARARRSRTLVVSGKTPAGWRVAPALADWLEHDGAGAPLADVAHTVNHHRGRTPKFATVCARDTPRR